MTVGNEMNYWNFAPSVCLGTFLLSAGYAFFIGSLRHNRCWEKPVPPVRQVAFYLGTLSMFLALTGPLDRLGDESLFSAHMAQHMLLTFVAPPLWLLGTPDWLIRRLVPHQILAWMVNPLIAFLLFNGAMWAWHLPDVYDAALANEALHIAEHLAFLAAGVIGWMPVLKPGLAAELTPLRRLIYLFPSMLSCTALAALITLSSVQLYHFYGSASLGWGLTPLSDQQLGGLAMWLPGDMLYMVLIVWMFKLMLDQTESETGKIKI
jgi:putative membrane protein